MKRDFFDIDLTRYFGFRNFGNASAMRFIFFFENVENLNYISNMQKKIQKKFFVFEIISSELVALNCLY